MIRNLIEITCDCSGEKILVESLADAKGWHEELGRHYSPECWAPIDTVQTVIKQYITVGESNRKCAIQVLEALVDKKYMAMPPILGAQGKNKL